MIHHDKHEIIKLVTPNFNKKLEIGFNTGLRPYRHGGIRIEMEKLQDKIVFHNYGHGGGGVSLFFGSIKQTLEIFEEFERNNNISNQTITVIGSGYLHANHI